MKLLAFLLLLGAPARAGDFSNAALGTAGAEYLTIDMSPRAVGMGGAYTAVANDSYALYWNPAGLNEIPKASLSFSEAKLPGPINFEYFGWGQRFNDSGAGAIGFRYMDAGTFASTDIDGNSLGDIHPRAYVADAGYGEFISEISDSETEMTVGATFRYSHSDLVVHGDLFCGDLGVQVHHNSDFLPWRFGGVLQNAGFGPKYDATRENLPLRGRLGVALYPTRFWIFSLDGSLPRDGQASLSAGSEVTLEAQEHLQAFLRAGVNSMLMAHGMSGMTGFSFGAGVKVFDFTFDYAFSPMGPLGDTHMFAVSFNLPQLGSRRYRER